MFKHRISCSLSSHGYNKNNSKKTVTAYFHFEMTFLWYLLSCPYILFTAFKGFLLESIKPKYQFNKTITLMWKPTKLLKK